MKLDEKKIIEIIRNDKDLVPSEEFTRKIEQFIHNGGKQRKTTSKNWAYVLSSVAVVLLLSLLSINYMLNRPEIEDKNNLSAEKQEQSAFTYPAENNEMEQTLNQLDSTSRQIFYYLASGKFEKVKKEYGTEFTIDENDKILFEDMDIPDLAITLRILKSMAPIVLLSGGMDEEGYFYLYYLLYSEREGESATQIFVQYEKNQNGDWILKNLRLNH